MLLIKVKVLLIPMAFGNGGTSVDPNRNYYIFDPTVLAQMQVRIIKTYTKVVDDRSVTNLDPKETK